MAQTLITSGRPINNPNGSVLMPGSTGVGSAINNYVGLGSNGLGSTDNQLRTGLIATGINGSSFLQSSVDDYQKGIDISISTNITQKDINTVGTVYADRNNDSGMPIANGSSYVTAYWSQDFRLVAGTPVEGLSTLKSPTSTGYNLDTDNAAYNPGYAIKHGLTVSTGVI